MTDIDALLILSYLRIGPITAQRLVERFSSPATIFRAKKEDLLRVRGISSDYTHRILSWEKKVDLSKAWQIIEQERITLLTVYDEAYPPLLKEIYDHPMLLFVKGTLQPQDAMSLGVVGTRHATNYGRVIARKWATHVAARGITVVSGLARGIDTEAHQGALEGNGRTIAVLGYGFGYVYPRENARLFETIQEHGAVITEYPWKQYIGKSSFPLRNRLIAGISRAVLVVESRARGGAMITAHFANEYNRTVLAVPGSLLSRASQGTHSLIRDGATLVRDVDDVMEEFDTLFASSGRISTQEKTKTTVSGTHIGDSLDGNEKILYALIDEPMTLDALSQKSDLSIEKVTAAMLLLELKGLVRMLPGKMYMTT